MKHRARWFIGLVVVMVALVGSTSPARARTRRAWRHAPPPPEPVYTAIASVDRSAMTITTTPKNSTGTATKTYHFTAQTKIDVDGQPGTMADLKTGQRIRVGLGASDDTAAELTVTSPPHGTVKPARGRRRER